MVSTRTISIHFEKGTSKGSKQHSGEIDEGSPGSLHGDKFQEGHCPLVVVFTFAPCDLLISTLSLQLFFVAWWILQKAGED